MKLSFRNLRRNKKRNLATGLAIACGFASVLLLTGYVWRVSNYLRVFTVYASRTGHLVLYHKGGLDRFVLNPRDFNIDETQQKKIDSILGAMPEVEFFGKQLRGSGLIGNGCTSQPFVAYGFEPELDRRLREHPEMRGWARDHTELLKGKNLWEYPEELAPVALSKGLARILSKKKVHDEIEPGKTLRVIQNCQSEAVKEELSSDANVQLIVGTWNGSTSAADGEVVAHFSTGFVETDSSAMWIPLSRMQKLYETSGIFRYSIWLRNPEEIVRVRKTLEARLAEAGVEADVYRWDDNQVSPLYVGTTQFLRAMSGFIAAVLAAVIAFSIFNSMTITVLERQQEIGTLRALGFTRKRIERVFFGEFTALTLISILVGSLFAGLAMLAVNFSDVRFKPPGSVGSVRLLLAPSWSYILWTAVAIFILTFFASVLSMRKANKKTIPILLSGAER